MASAAADRIIHALQQLQQQHKRDLRQLRDRLAKALFTEDLDLKQVGLSKQTEYDGYVAKGVYFDKPFPCSMNMSSSVPRCTELILEFLRHFRGEAKRVTRDWPKLVKYCLQELLTEVLPDELKKAFENHRRFSKLTAQGAKMLYANIKVLRSSMGNPHFSEIRQDCHSDLDLGNPLWKKWEELVKESKKVKDEKKKSPKLLIKPTPQAHKQLPAPKKT